MPPESKQKLPPKMEKLFSIHSTSTEVPSTGPIYIFDIDGTIADVQHRLVHIKAAPRNWPMFFQDAVYDKPISWVIDVMRQFPHERIVMITGRSDIIATLTIDWLLKHDVPYGELRMRAQNNFKADQDLKPEMAKDYWDRIAFIVEDRQSVVDMWRSKGKNVLQCAAWQE